MITKARFFNLMQKITKQIDCDGILVSYMGAKKNVIKFNAAEVLQNMEENDISLCFTVYINHRSGTAYSSSFNPTAVKDAILSAKHIALHKPKDKVYMLPAEASRKKIKKQKTFFLKTVKNADDYIVDWIKQIRAKVKKHKLDVSGTITTGHEQIGVFSTTGIRQFQDLSFASPKIIPHKDTSTGFASAIHRDVRKIDIAEVIDHGIRTCVLNKNQIDLNLGKYDCILSPEAVGEIMSWLLYIGFGGKSVYDKTSFLHNKMNKKITGKNITIIDDGVSDPRTSIGFDFEGLRRQKIVLIDKGIARGYALDSYFGKLLKKKSTGHALTPGETIGPLPLHICMKPGKSSLDEMIKTLDKGLLINRFHYLNGFINTHKATMTGLTRNGLFLIKNGKISEAVKNMRFTDNILEAFSRITHISKDLHLVTDSTSALSTFKLPYVLIRDFNFTGKT